jgi:cytoskeleton protein RodZ
MNDSVISDSLPSEAGPEKAAAALTAGAILRQARQARGLHIAALATSIKVSPQKLELLETDRIDELPGATFTRALAQTVCRSLKIDAAPVLALLPQPVDRGLEQMSLGLNAPFRERPGRRVPTDFPFLKNPIVLAALVLVIAALAVYLLPAHWFQDHVQALRSPSSSSTQSSAETVPVVIGDAASASGSSTSTTVETIYSPAPEAPAASAASSTPMPASQTAGALKLAASAESWIEVLDANGTSLLSRMLRPGETVGVDGASPLRVKIGNAAATTVTFKGKAIDLAPSRDNVARLELK